MFVRDIKPSHTQLFSPRTYDTSGSESEYNSSNYDGDSSGDECDENAKDTTEDCTCMEESQSDDGNDDLESVDEDDLFTVYVGIEKADPLCAKIHDLIQRGKISKDRIF